MVPQMKGASAGQQRLGEQASKRSLSTFRPAVHTGAARKLARSTGQPLPASHRPGPALKVGTRATGSTAEAPNDVYVYEPTPLKEGEEKHVISVFVADEAGLINRVAGVFARRGANIESLAVGLTLDKALFTIVVTGSSSTVSNLVKQTSKLVKVRYVEDITRSGRVERELVLMKVDAPPGQDRTEVLQLANIFRAKVVDVSEAYLTLVVTGDPGKVAAFQRAMAKYGIAELARTGRVCLKRGTALLEQAVQAMPEGAGVRRPRPPPVPAMASRDADVYMVDDGDSGEPGVWEADPGLLTAELEDPVLEPISINDMVSTPSVGFDAAAQGLQPHTLSIEVSDTPGVLNQVTGVIARRGYSIQSLAVGPSEREGHSRITCTLPGTASSVQKLLTQLNKLVCVDKVVDLTGSPFVARELMLLKVRCMPSQRSELLDIATIFRGNIIDVSPNTVTLEVVGKDAKAKGLTDVLEPYGVLEVCRTGRVALARESGVNTAYLENKTTGRVW